MTALLFEVEWLQYFIVKAVFRSGKMSRVEYHSDAAQAATAVFRPWALTLCTTSSISRLWHLLLMVEVERYQMALSHVIVGTAVFAVYNMIRDTANDDSKCRCNWEHLVGLFYLTSALLPSVGEALLGIWRGGALTHLVTCIGLVGTVVAYRMSVDTTKAFLIVLCGFIILMAPALSHSWDMWWHAWNLVITTIFSLGAMLYLFAFQEDLRNNPNQRGSLQLHARVLVIVTTGALLYITLSTFHHCLFRAWCTECLVNWIELVLPCLQLFTAVAAFTGRLTADFEYILSWSGFRSASEGNCY